MPCCIDDAKPATKATTSAWLDVHTRGQGRAGYRHFTDLPSCEGMRQVQVKTDLRPIGWSRKIVTDSRAGR
jgi:hypothetical protein